MCIRDYCVRVAGLRGLYVARTRGKLRHDTLVSVRVAWASVRVHRGMVDGLETGTFPTANFDLAHAGGRAHVHMSAAEL